MDHPETELELIKRSKDKFRWWVKNDMDKFGDLLDDNALIVHANGKTESKIQALDGIGSKRTVYKNIEIHKATCRLFGKTAIVTGDGDFTTVTGEQTNSIPMEFTEVYVQQDREWKLVSAHFSRRF
jgi:ketosteroid isomerase-like protein